MIQPSLPRFVELARKGSVVPVYRELLADMETPVSVFQKLEATSEHAFMLESVENGEKLGRYTFLGADPAVILRVRGNRQEILSGDKSLAPKATPIETLRFLLSRYRPVIDPNLPPFFGGAVGYMSYDTVRYYERIPDECPDELQLPDCLVMIADTLVVFDHVKHRMILVANARVDGAANLQEAYTEAALRLDGLRARVLAPGHVFEEGFAAGRKSNGDSEQDSEEYLRRLEEELRAADRAPTPQSKRAEGLSDFYDLNVAVSSNMDKLEYMGIVRKAKEYITAGDIFQVVLSQRFSTEISCKPFDVYRALRAVNPSPYMFYLKCGEEFQLAGSSPEILSKLQGGSVTVRPIAGTRKRGATPEEDEALAAELLADEKERAEHVMLVDLGRNDVGRVSQFGTVTVNDFMVIERYSHVMHIVSNVTGSIAPGKDGFDVLAATFPAGTLSGAPKIRAMEIIDELETHRRGPYGGSVVYFSFDGTMDSCITIRTAVIKGKKVYVQAGAGIVADSDPETEYLETVNKAKGMFKAIEMAEQGLE